MPKGFKSLILAITLLTLAACESSEERAQKHFENGTELLEGGDTPRAIIEFRNALALNENHREARLSYARTARASGNVPEAYSNYLWIAEASPNNAEARLALSEMAIVGQNWEEAVRHAAALRSIGSGLEREKIITVALAFRDAAIDEDMPAIRAKVREAESLAEQFPDDDILARILVEGYRYENRLDEAIAIASSMIASETDNQLFYQVKTELLLIKGDTIGLEEHLRAMLTKFPDDNDVKGQLIRLLIVDGRGPQAEEFLREEVARAEDKPSVHVSLIAMVRQLRGDEAALEEIETALTAHGQPPVIAALKAGLLFDLGQRDTSIELMESITRDVEPSAQVDDFKVMLAKMLVQTGNEVGARQLVEAVLDHDSGQVEALKMQANWQISADETEAAIASLRIALDGAPDDAETMTIMARAHERNGDIQLARDLLALAVDASGNAPDESLRYARTQIAQERYNSAEEILISALRRVPGEPRLLVTLGQVYLATGDWSRAEQVANTLRAQNDRGSQLAADDLELQIIANREGRDQGLGFLEELVENSADTTAAKIALIQARLEDAQGQAALALANELVAEAPGDTDIALVLGNTQLALALFADAEATFRNIRAAEPENSVAVIQLLRSLVAQDRQSEAAALAREALQFQPENPDLLWAQASFLENDNDFESAIDIYERLYAMDSENMIVANNLASLLVTYRTDQGSLERAITVGKRLKDATFPPFQDTYGWLLFRQGRYAEALGYLQDAASALLDDPIVQYHLGKAYLELGRTSDAIAQFETALAVAGDDDPRPQLAEAKAEIERLSIATE